VLNFAPSHANSTANLKQVCVTSKRMNSASMNLRFAEYFSKSCHFSKPNSFFFPSKVHGLIQALKKKWLVGLTLLGFPKAIRTREKARKFIDFATYILLLSGLKFWY